MHLHISLLYIHKYRHMHTCTNGHIHISLLYIHAECYTETARNFPRRRGGCWLQCFSAGRLSMDCGEREGGRQREAEGGREEVSVKERARARELREVFITPQETS